MTFDAQQLANLIGSHLFHSIESARRWIEGALKSSWIAFCRWLVLSQKNVFKQVHTQAPRNKSYIYWPGMDAVIENSVENNFGNKFQKCQQAAEIFPLRSRTLAQGWETVDATSYGIRWSYQRYDVSNRCEFSLKAAGGNPPKVCSDNVYYCFFG